MPSTDNRYHATGILLRVLATILFFIALAGRSASLFAIALGYWMAAGNPWKHRVVIIVGLILHSLLLCPADI